MKFRERRSGVPSPYSLPSGSSRAPEDMPPGRGGRNRLLLVLLAILALTVLAGAAVYYYLYGFEVAPWIPWVASTSDDDSETGEPTEGTESRATPTPTQPVYRGPRFPVGHLVGAERAKQIDVATADGVEGREAGPRRRFLLLNFSVPADATGTWALTEFQYRSPRREAYSAVSYSTGTAIPFAPFAAESGRGNLDFASIPAAIEEIVLLFEVSFLDLMSEGTFVWRETEVAIPEIQTDGPDQ